jgi:hypothetical protein
MKTKLTASCLLAMILLAAGCASYRIPTPCGDARITTVLKNVEVPKITVSASNATITVEGYSGKGDSETITATATAIGAIAGSAAKTAVK